MMELLTFKARMTSSNPSWSSGGGNILSGDGNILSGEKECGKRSEVRGVW